MNHYRSQSYALGGWARASLVGGGLALGLVAAACTVTTQSARPTGDAAASRGYDPARLDGEVLGVEHVPPGDRMAGNVRVQLRLDKGKPITVVLAPGWYLDEKGFKLELHRRVQVVEASREGSSIVARSISVEGQLLQLRDAEGKPMWGIAAPGAAAVGSTTEQADAAPQDEDDETPAKAPADDAAEEPEDSAEENGDDED